MVNMDNNIIKEDHVFTSYSPYFIKLLMTKFLNNDQLFSKSDLSYLSQYYIKPKSGSYVYNDNDDIFRNNIKDMNYTEFSTYLMTNKDDAISKVYMIEKQRLSHYINKLPIITTTTVEHDSKSTDDMLINFITVDLNALKEGYSPTLLQLRLDESMRMIESHNNMNDFVSLNGIIKVLTELSKQIKMTTNTPMMKLDEPSSLLLGDDINTSLLLSKQEYPYILYTHDMLYKLNEQYAITKQKDITANTTTIIDTIKKNIQFDQLDDKNKEIMMNYMNYMIDTLTLTIFNIQVNNIPDDVDKSYHLKKMMAYKRFTNQLYPQ